jgi:Arc/MetJ family transcription regulator
MRTTIALDDELLANAQAFTGLPRRSALVRAAFRALIERESARRLARLGGNEPDLATVRGRRPRPARVCARPSQIQAPSAILPGANHWNVCAWLSP